MSPEARFQGLKVVVLIVSVAGGIALFYFTFRAREGVPNLTVAFGWNFFYLLAHFAAFLWLPTLGVKLAPELYFGATFCATLPVIVSSFGPARERIWGRVQWSLKEGWVTFILAAAICFAFHWAYVRFYELLAHARLPHMRISDHVREMKLISWWLPYVVYAILGPVTEEICSRGYQFDALRKRISGRATIVVTALAFALFHMNWRHFPLHFVAGLILGWLRWRSGSLRIPILFHALNNGLFVWFVKV